MKHIIASAAIATFLVLPSAELAFAGAGNPSGTGQPNASCETDTGARPPGNTAGSPGSPFADGGKAGQVYAGERTTNGNSGNPASGNSGAQASQYDVACVRGPPG
jgi:hypothetical protein